MSGPGVLPLCSSTGKRPPGPGFSPRHTRLSRLMRLVVPPEVVAAELERRLCNVTPATPHTTAMQRLLRRCRRVGQSRIDGICCMHLKTVDRARRPCSQGRCGRALARARTLVAVGLLNEQDVGRTLARARTPHPATVIMETLHCVMETLRCNVSTGVSPRLLSIPPSTFHLQTCNIRRTA